MIYWVLSMGNSQPSDLNIQFNQFCWWYKSELLGAVFQKSRTRLWRIAPFQHFLLKFRFFCDFSEVIEANCWGKAVVWKNYFEFNLMSYWSEEWRDEVVWKFREVCFWNIVESLLIMLVRWLNNFEQLQKVSWFLTMEGL